MSNLRNCSRCGRVFPYMGRNICPRCLEKEEDEYQVVRRYVRDNPGAGVIEVVEETGVEEDKILQFLRDGRLQAKGLTASLHCERCGQSINSGRFCESCINEVNAEIQGHLPQKAKSEEPKRPPRGKVKDKMHIKDRGFF